MYKQYMSTPSVGHPPYTFHGTDVVVVVVVVAADLSFWRVYIAKKITITRSVIYYCCYYYYYHHHLSL